MTLPPIHSTRLSAGLDRVSPLVMAIVDHLRPSIVQIRREQHGGGAGFVWHSDGMVLTNDHVVGDNGNPVQVYLADGRVFEARAIARDSALDLALLEVMAKDLPAIPMGDSTSLRVGQLVFAIGHPWGQRGVVTAGIVSGLGATPVADGTRTVRYIRSDVRLAPGNSGGPLIDATGAVVGINAMIFGGDLGVAVPSHEAIAWLAQRLTRPISLGLQLQPVPLPAGFLAATEPGRVTGLLVVGVEPDGPAAGGGLLVGDLLLDAAGNPLEGAAILRHVLARCSTTEPLRLRLWRGGLIREIAVNLGSLEHGV